jgi:hypothetical protein
MHDYKLRSDKNHNPVYHAMVNNEPEKPSKDPRKAEKPSKDPRKAEKEKFKIMLKNKLKSR